MKINSISLLLVSIIFQSCSLFDIDRIDLNNISWLLGDWHSEEGESIITESWIKVSENTFEGYGETRDINSGSISNFESLRLLFLSDEIFYLAKVNHNELPIAFKLTSISETSLIFENKDHDFPTKIEYVKVSENKMAVIVGNDEKEFTINFTRK